MSPPRPSRPSLASDLGRALFLAAGAALVLALCARGEGAHGVARFAAATAERAGAGPGAVAGAFALGCALLLALRFGRIELALLAGLPPAFGFGLAAAARGGNFRFGEALLGGLLAVASSAGLVGRAQATWRRSLPTSAGFGPRPFLWTLAPAIVLALGSPRAGSSAGGALEAFLWGGLPAALLVPPGARLLFVHRGANGCPAPRDAWGALWILWTMAGRGLLVLARGLGARSEAERQRRVVEGVGRIARKVVRDAPCGEQQVRGAFDALERPCVIVANHASMFDIVRLLSLTPRSVLLVKRWVLRVPLLGHVARAAGYLDVESLGAGEALARARAAVESGLSVVVFPEGSRARDGYPVRRFRNGAFALARSLGVPVVPVAIAGSVFVVRAGTWWLGPFSSRSEVLPPLEPGGFEGPLADRRMAQAARERVEEAFWRLWRESQAAPGWAEPLARAYRLLGATVGHYAASKLRRDPVLAALPELCPGEGKVLQLGCGLGLASARLALYDPRRTIRGLDHDPRKVALARAALGETTGARFELGDAFTAPLGRPEVVLLIDVLHYWPYEEQDRLLARCAEALPAGGRLVLREGTLDAPGHRWVAWGERLALSLGFTRGGAGLFFDTEEGLRARVRRAGFAVRSAHPELGLGSNTVLVCERVARAEFAAGGSP